MQSRVATCEVQELQLLSVRKRSLSGDSGVLQAVADLLEQRRAKRITLSARSGSGRSNTELSGRPRVLSLRPARSQTGIVHDARLRLHKHPFRTHPEKPERIDAALEQLQAQNFLTDCTVLSCSQLPTEVAACAHYSSYLTLLSQLQVCAFSTCRESSRQTAHILAGEQSAGQEELLERMNAFESVFANEHSIDCAFLAAGGLIRLVEQVVTGSLCNGFALIRPPGHHAEPHAAMGFSFLNNVAIAAKHAVTQLGLERVMIFDWDIHHGNGTQRIFYQDPSVLYISMHRYDHGSFFPGTCEGSSTRVGHGAGRGFNVNVPFNGAGIGDADFLRAFESVVRPIAEDFDPQLILVSAGFDAAEGDPIGQCNVTPTCYEWMTHELQKLAGGRVILTLEGGYRPSMIAECVSRCVRALVHESDPNTLKDWKAHVIGDCPCCGGTNSTIRAAIAAHKPFWKRLADSPTQL
jgi:histone deacetylase 6